MKVNMSSNILKLLLVLFAIGCLFIGTYILPLLAKEMVTIHPTLEYAKMPILVICEILLAMLLIGIAIIMHLLIKFDKGLTFETPFIRGLEILVGMCIVASIGVIFLFFYMTTFGGPGPTLSLIMIGVTFIIWIVAAVMMLIRAIVKKAMVFKDDYDMTV